MAKPILVVRINAASYGPEQRNKTASMARKNISEMLNHEYHVMIIFKEEGEVEFQAHNADKLPPITKSQLHEIVAQTTV